MKKRFTFIAALLAFGLIAAACGDAGDDTTTTTAADSGTTVLDLAADAGQFTTLIAAVDAAGLTDTLNSEGPFTVLAPTDAAFTAAFDLLGITADQLLADTDTLTSILTYHVLAQEADSSVVATLDGQSVETVNGESVLITVDGEAIMVDDATVVTADLGADNGIVHVIDGVLLPAAVAEALGVAMDDEMMDDEMAEPTIAETVATLAAADPAEFTVLLAALETASLVEALNNPDDELTVFAPTDAAFTALLADLDVSADELLANPDLAGILLYHVVAGVFPASAVIDSAPINGLATLNADATLDIEVVDGSVVVNGSATVIQADVMASNGVVHVIDAVLVP